jgi:hypothetical protein
MLLILSWKGLTCSIEFSFYPSGGASLGTGLLRNAPVHAA